MLKKAGSGFGALALGSMLSADTNKPFAPSKLTKKIAHHPSQAKSVIFLFMEGGPSQLDLFDPKPLINKLDGKQVPSSFKIPITAMGEYGAPILGCQRKWARHGDSGLWMSDWLPHTSKMADDMAIIRSCVSDGINHAGGVCQMNTGSIFGGRPSLGSWVSYGLGNESSDLPSFVVMKDTKSQVINGPRSWGAGFMPASYQGVEFESSGPPIRFLKPQESHSRHTSKLNLLRQINQNHFKSRQDNSELDARIKSYELAYRMQSAAPEAVDIEHEPKSIKEMYGLDKKETKVFGSNCLLARRLVERGVRFIQLYSGSGSKWDAHKNLESNHSSLCKATDQPIAALLKDLKQRGLLDSTLVVWGGEFGRTPMSEKGDGRDHNPTGFTMWMAGGGVKGGQTIGATDELGLWAVQDKMHVHDIHSTILNLMGVDHTKLIYHHKGRPERIDMNEGYVNEKLSG
jgi:hypothetical protein